MFIRLLKTASFLIVAAMPLSAAELVKFNDSWRFHKGEAAGAEMPDFADTAWRQVRLPHDWAIEGPFDRKYNARAGGLPFHGVGWYRKTFTTPAERGDKQVMLVFEGAMNNSTVWLNGHKLGGRPDGYAEFMFDITSHLRAGEPNVLAVRLAPEDLSSRWYPGAGIYRDVWLEMRHPLHVVRWGTFITTPRVSDKKATVQVRTTLGNTLEEAREVVLETILRDAAGAEVAREKTPISLIGGSRKETTQNLVVNNPRRWDVSDPHLYTATSRVLFGDTLSDTCDTRFGIRTIEYHPSNGFLLNGRRVQFQGVCNHHDLGPLGSAVNRRATARQLEIMKDMGVNAIRTSHNPPSRDLLELCDEMGLLVQDEAFDVWQVPKTPNGYNKHFDEWHERDLRDMIHRDRNHPSIVMWSIGNEILEQNLPEGHLLTRRLTGICRAEDPTRPVTAGFNGYPSAVKNKLAHELDVVGFNYKPAYYEEVLREHPHWVVYGSETASTVSSRGVYHLPLEKYVTHPSLQITSYDIIGPPWAYPPDIEFHQIEKNPRILGEFIWTGFDYLGEPTPFGGKDNSTDGYWNADWPAHTSYFGAVDLAGFPKDRFYLYQSQWTKKPMVHLLPHWNWPGHEGKPVPVMAYTTGDEAELFLNGKSLGRRKKGVDLVELPVSFNGWKEKTFASPYRLGWEVPFEPGSLKVVAYKDGVEIATKEIRTAGPPARLRLIADRTEIAADGDDLSFVTVRVEDADGNFCPLADDLLEFTVEGAGKLEAVTGGNPISVESFQADRCRAFNGLGLAVVRSSDEPGPITLSVKSPFGQAETIKLEAKSATKP